MVASDTSHAGSAGATIASERKASAPTRLARDHMSDLPRLGLSEQSIGAEDKDERHHGIDDEKLELGNEVDRRGATQTNDERTDQRALDRAQAADNDHRERKYDHLDADAERYRDFRRHRGTAERAQHRSEHEGEREHDRHIDAEGGRGFPIEH